MNLHDVHAAKLDRKRQQLIRILNDPKTPREQRPVIKRKLHHLQKTKQR